MNRPDTKTLRLLAVLRSDGRATLTNIARKMGMPISTTFDRLRTLEETEIKRYTALIDFGDFGFSARAFLLIRCAKQHKEELTKHLLHHHSVNTLIQINNGWDLLAETVFPDIRRLEEFLDTIEPRFGIKTLQVHYVIDDLRREGFLADPDTADTLHSSGRSKV